MSFKLEIPNRTEASQDGDRKVPVTIEREGQSTTIEVWRGYRLWDAMLDAKVPFWKLCGGEGVCGTCRVNVKDGAANLTPKTFLEKSGDELAFPLRALVWTFWALHGVFRRPAGWRLACQSYVQGPVTVISHPNPVDRVCSRLAPEPRPASHANS